MYIGKCILYVHWLFQSMLQSLLWYYHYPLCSRRSSEPTADISQNMFCQYFLTVTLIPGRIPFCRDRWQIQSPSCAVLVKQYVFHWCDMLCMSSILFFLLFSLTCNSQLGIHLVALHWRVLWGQSPWSFSKASLWKLIKDIIVEGQEKSLHQNSAGKKSDCYWNIWSNCVKISVYVCNNI